MRENDLWDRLDADQKKAVALRANGAVSAGAGSGKTTVLAARYIDLVTQDFADVRSILVLTFTRKAAAQMYGRIYRELLASREPRVREQVDRFAEAQISTLDSFCSLILRPEAQEYGYPPDFRVDDGECGRIAEAQALSFLLERREDPNLGEIFARLGFEAAWKGLFADAASRLWTPAFAPDVRAMAELQRTALNGLIRRNERTILEAAHSAAEETGGAQHLGAKAAQAAAALGSLPSDLETLNARAAAQAVQPIADLGLAGFGRSDPDTRVKEQARLAREAARSLLDASDMEDQAPLAEAALSLLAELGERVRRAKRSSRVMSFRDVASSAVDLLTRRTDVRAYWKRRFRFIMIDEFQDDDETQKDLLYLLAEQASRSDPSVPAAEELEPDKLFFVGDEKQSIYRFRGADVSVFRGLSEDLALGGSSLRTNYRSEPILIDFFNDLFARVLRDAEKSFEARFESISARAATEGVEPSIRYLIKKRRAPAEREGYRSDDEAQAYAIACFVKDCVEGRKLRVPQTERYGDDSPPWRYAGYDDFAILLRTTGKQYQLEKFLRLLGVPYSAGDVCGLFSESPANDIYQALRLAAHPEDGPAYASFLRSPFVRVSDDAFVRILTLDLPALDPEAVGKAGLSEDDAARFRRGRGILDRVSAAADRDSLADIVSRLWYREGLRLSLLRKPDAHPFLEHFDYIFRLAADADARCLTLASFVSELEPLAGTPERLPDLDAPREEISGLRILTVHKAKGLEFPVVILPFLEGTGKSGGNGQAWYDSKEHGVTLNLKPWDDPLARKVNVFYDMAREEEAEQEKAELKRLFYVACTRASAHLVFAATEPDSADNRGASFHSLLAGGNGLRDDSGSFPSLPETVKEISVPDLSETDYLRLFGGRRTLDMETMLPSYERSEVPERSWTRREVPASSLNAAWTESRDAPGAEALEPGEERLPALDYDGLSEEIPPNLFGEICHAAVEAELDRRGKGKTLLEAALALAPGDARDRLASEAQRLAAGFLASDLGRAAQGAAKLTLESSFLYGVGEDLSIVGRTDLLFETKDEIVVVDFKSDRIRKAAEYDGQMAAYRAACRDLYPGRAVRTCLFWLRSAQAEERFPVPEEERRLAEAARRAASDPEGRGSAPGLL